MTHLGAASAFRCFMASVVLLVSRLFCSSVFGLSSSHLRPLSRPISEVLSRLTRSTLHYDANPSKRLLRFLSCRDGGRILCSVLQRVAWGTETHRRFITLGLSRHGAAFPHTALLRPGFKCQAVEAIPSSSICQLREPQLVETTGESITGMTACRRGSRHTSDRA